MRLARRIPGEGNDTDMEAKDLTAADVLRRYTEEALPEFYGIVLENVNQVGNSGDRPLHVASVRGDLDEVAALVAGGADVNAPGDLGYTPLHEAAAQGHISVVKFLLDHGAWPHGKNEFGKSILEVAAPQVRTEIARLLKP